MLKMSGFDVLFAVAGHVYLLFALACICIALWKGKTGARKAIYALLVLALFMAPITPGIYRTFEYQNRLAKAQVLFQERCKTAGERIYRTATDVDGVFVINPRTENINYDQQFKLDDPYGYAGTGENYLKMFVRGRPTIPTKIGDQLSPNNVVSYSFVEIADETGRNFYRYTTSMSKEDSEKVTRNGGGSVNLDREHTTIRAAKYGISWADISTREDRESWIAGSSQKIVDLQTNEVLAERIGYMFDSGLGNTAGGRSPWSYARNTACPPLNEKTFYFFDRVIQPTVTTKK